MGEMLVSSLGGLEAMSIVKVRRPVRGKVRELLLARFQLALVVGRHK